MDATRAPLKALQLFLRWRILLPLLTPRQKLLRLPVLTDESFFLKLAVSASTSETFVNPFPCHPLKIPSHKQPSAYYSQTQFEEPSAQVPLTNLPSTHSVPPQYAETNYRNVAHKRKHTTPRLFLYNLFFLCLLANWLNIIHSQFTRHAEMC